jgi:hypothetical protein
VESHPVVEQAQYLVMIHSRIAAQRGTNTNEFI